MSTPRVSLDRLRERTDELELLISGLSLVGLFALPGALTDAYFEVYSRLPVPVLAALNVAIPMLTAMAHALAACLVLHLSVRAYWVGLVGLRSVYPDGIRWDAPGMGPVQRARLEASNADPEAAVARADRWASTIFAVFVFCALSMAVLAAWLTVTMIIGAAVGGGLKATNASMTLGIGLFVFALLAAIVSLWLLDGVVARRFPRVLAVPGVARLIRAIAWLVGRVFPEKLFVPLRMPLQTHLRRRTFFLLLVVVFYGLPWMGLYLVEGRMTFDPFGTQTHVTADDLLDGHKSSHYESQRVPSDRMRAVPMIPAPLVEAEWLPLFLPYLAIRDDEVLAHRCAKLPADAADPVDARGSRAARCLATLWEVRLNGRPVDLSSFTTAQRADLGFRGLTGYIDLQQGVPGPNTLTVRWRPEDGSDPPMDDLVPASMDMTIPFLWSPQRETPR